MSFDTKEAAVLYFKGELTKIGLSYIGEYNTRETRECFIREVTDLATFIGIDVGIETSQQVFSVDVY